MASITSSTVLCFVAAVISFITSIPMLFFLLLLVLFVLFSTTRIAVTTAVSIIAN